jgi:iron complex outermembrane receptor protein
MRSGTRRHHRLLPVAFVSLGVSTVHAAPDAPSGDTNSFDSSARPPSSARWQTQVRGTLANPVGVQLERDQLMRSEGPHVGASLAEQPGVSAVRKAADATDLVVRGLGRERIRTFVAGVPVYGACPSRMDPPVTYIGSHGVERLSLAQGMPSVVGGLPGLGGTLEIDLDYERSPGAAPEAHSDASLSYDSARAGLLFSGSIYGGNRWADLRLSGGVAQLDDYVAGDGTQIEAGLQQSSVAVSLGLRPSANQRFWQGLVYRQDRRIRYPSLPMDNIDTDFWLYAARYRLEPRRGRVRKVILNGGLTRVDHLMDNRYKANRSRVRASTPAKTRSYVGAARAELALGRRHTLDLGLDSYALTRDATRTRRIVSTGMVFRDRIWPDTQQIDVGAFAELRSELGSGLTLRSAIRADVIHSSARATEAPSLGGQTVKQQYAAYYGDVEDSVDRTEPLGTASLLLQWSGPSGFKPFVGTSLTMRAASITERYFAFGPAPSGFQVGNPALASEKRWSADMGIRWRREWLSIRLAGYYARVGDFILESLIDRRDVNGDGQDNAVRGFRNITAHLAGFEIAATYRPLPFVSVPLTLSYVRGWNGSDRRDLPEIPPLEGTAALRLHWRRPLKWWVQIGTRFAAPQRFVDERFGEDTTDGFALLNVRTGVALTQHLDLEMLAENLLDTTYNEHLTREALLPSGDLQPGDEVLAPGRRLVLTLSGKI